MKKKMRPIVAVICAAVAIAAVAAAVGLVARHHRKTTDDAGYENHDDSNKNTLLADDFWADWVPPTAPPDVISHKPRFLIPRSSIRQNTGLGKDFDVYMHLIPEKSVPFSSYKRRNDIKQGAKVLVLEHLVDGYSDNTMVDGYSDNTTEMRETDIDIVFVPNQELLDKTDVFALTTDTRVKFVLCKSRYAASIFQTFKQKHECAWQVVCFKFPPIVREPLYSFGKDRKVVFHPAGRSWMKNTSSVVEAWSRHPEWPQLFVTCDQDCLVNHSESLSRARSCKNVYISTFLPTDDMLRLQRHAGYTILPSACEGFGHGIYEAMANASLLISSDVPPMNEHLEHMRNSILAKPSQTVYIGYSDSCFEWTKHLASDFGDAGSACYLVTPESVEVAVAAAIALDDQTYTRIRETAVNDWSRMMSEGLLSTRVALEKAGFAVQARTHDPVPDTQNVDASSWTYYHLNTFKISNEKIFLASPTIGNLL